VWSSSCKLQQTLTSCTLPNSKMTDISELTPNIGRTRHTGPLNGRREISVRWGRGPMEAGRRGNAECMTKVMLAYASDAEGWTVDCVGLFCYLLPAVSPTVLCLPSDGGKSNPKVKGGTAKRDLRDHRHLRKADYTTHRFLQLRTEAASSFVHFGLRKPIIWTCRSPVPSIVVAGSRLFSTMPSSNCRNLRTNDNSHFLSLAEIPSVKYIRVIGRNSVA